MKDNELLFDRKSHVLYSKPCKKEILAKIALHYPEADDMELQAVITAAIAMYEEDMASASGDAYVARPIRRKGKRA